ncbi:Methylthioribose-1-phosphate isomerase [Lachnellula hyalina]|uniref:Methylthioribose-1-phosphate isomerase n=1 Tax=Lachnellula hyalina TaxID=1316788 RepID=A0A8H8RA23_9HELO|nr:Methylthioribose-1-phosphate isomerase [Lachnellula hyalina]TVY30442.1 Methylthioribose-1-phosphate isomerase [Lachnellula hyalina]
MSAVRTSEAAKMMDQVPPPLPSSLPLHWLWSWSLKKMVSEFMARNLLLPVLICLDAHRKEETATYISKRLDYLMGSRPTAVDLSNAIKLLKSKTEEVVSVCSTSDQAVACADVRLCYIETAEKILADDFDTNLSIGRYGAEYLRRQEMPILKPVDEAEEFRYYTTSPPGTQGAPDMKYRKLSVLTHCNTGSLATSGHGTALGIIRSLHKMNYLEHAYCTETRPYNQGSRLTAFELAFEKIPATLITDSMAGALFSRMKNEKNISAVIVGADRVARNGDTANKIGTYTLAVLAKYHGIKFVVAAPTTSIDLSTESGAKIKIEDRAKSELTQITGAIVNKDGTVDTSKSARVAIADQTIDVWNPSFDVTPHELIDAIITEKGEVLRNSKGEFHFKDIIPERWRRDVPNGSDAETNGSSAVPGTPSEEGTQFAMEV